MKKQLIVMLIIMVVVILIGQGLIFSQDSNSSLTNETNSSMQKLKIEKTTQVFKFFDLFRMGGFFMWFLLLASILAAGFIVERMIYYSKFDFEINNKLGKIKDLIREGKEPEAEKYCMLQHTPTGDAFCSGLKMKNYGADRMEKSIDKSVEECVANLDKGLSIISAIGNITPLIGFLGTVSGMINAFKAIAVAETVSPKIVATGIYEALITTATGLVIAIPTIAFYNYFISRIENYSAEMTKAANEIVEEVLIHDTQK